jgi:hypothetical protein
LSLVVVAVDMVVLGHLVEEEAVQAASALVLDYLLLLVLNIRLLLARAEQEALLALVKVTMVGTLCLAP